MRPNVVKRGQQTGTWGRHHVSLGVKTLLSQGEKAPPGKASHHCRAPHDSLFAAVDCTTFCLS